MRENVDLEDVMGKKCGQSFSEYVFFIVTFTAALFATQAYIQSGIQAKLRDILVRSNFTGAPHPVKDDASGVSMYINATSNVKQNRSTGFTWDNGKFKYVEETETVTDEKEK